MFIQSAINETTLLPLKRNDVPIPKTGQHKESFKMQKNSTVTQYLYERENPMVECMRCYE